MTKSELAQLPSKTLVNTADLCSALNVNARTIRRMVSAGTLPPSIRIGGSNAWFAGAVIGRFQQLADERAALAQTALARVKRAFP